MAYEQDKHLGISASRIAEELGVNCQVRNDGSGAYIYLWDDKVSTDEEFSPPSTEEIENEYNKYCIEILKKERNNRLSRVINVLDQHRNEQVDGGALTRTADQIALWQQYRRALLAAVESVESGTVDADAVVWPAAPEE